MTLELPGGAVGGSQAGFGESCGAKGERDRTAELYFIGRMRASMAQAEASTDASARLVHFELAGRYGVAALAAGLRKDPARCRLRP